MAEEPSLAVLLERLENFRGEMRGDVGELKTMAACTNDRLTGFEKNYTTEHALVVRSTDRAHTRLDEHDRRIADMEGSVKNLTTAIDALKEAVGPLVWTNRIMVFFAGLIATAIVGLVWGLLTGQITLVMR